jgi:hypothetical protein
MHATASALSAGLLTLWALVALADKPAPLPAAATTPAPLVTAPAAPSALGDLNTLSRYPGN